MLCKASYVDDRTIGGGEDGKLTRDKRIKA